MSKNSEQSINSKFTYENTLEGANSTSVGNSISLAPDNRNELTLNVGNGLNTNNYIANSISSAPANLIANSISFGVANSTSVANSISLAPDNGNNATDVTTNIAGETSDFQSTE